MGTIAIEKIETNKNDKENKKKITVCLSENC